MKSNPSRLPRLIRDSDLASVDFQRPRAFFWNPATPDSVRTRLSAAFLSTEGIPRIESHYVSARNRRQPGVLVFLAQNGQNHTFCLATADLRQGEKAGEIFPVHCLLEEGPRLVAQTRRLRFKTPFWAVFQRDAEIRRSALGVGRYPVWSVG